MRHLISIKLGRVPSFLLLILMGIYGVIACQGATPEVQISATPDEKNVVAEFPIKVIPLEGQAAQRRAEISGMAWCGDQLILLPQYPDRFMNEKSASVFSIPRETLEAFLSGELTTGIEPVSIPFDQGDLNKTLGGFEGFEGIAFEKDRFYAVIETRQSEGMLGYIVMGRVEGDCTRLIVDATTLAPITPQADLGNMSDETVVLYGDQVISIYEANGGNINPQAKAHVFDRMLETFTLIDMATVEYRITDATTPDDEGLFWAINYFYPGDTKLIPAPDLIARDYGIGESHLDADQVERLIAFEIGGDAIVLAEREPIYLRLEGTTARNWEGVVRFGEGFLLVTDEHPSTILGYLEAP